MKFRCRISLEKVRKLKIKGNHLSRAYISFEWGLKMIKSLIKIDILTCKHRQPKGNSQIKLKLLGTSTQGWIQGFS